MPGGRYFSVNKYWEVIFKGVYLYGDTGVENNSNKRKGIVTFEKKKIFSKNLIVKTQLYFLIKSLRKVDNSGFIQSIGRSSRNLFRHFLN